MRQLAVYLALRTVLAGVLESFVLSDRLRALRERAAGTGGVELGDVRMFPVFDETLSPRNVILLAKRA